MMQTKTYVSRAIREEYERMIHPSGLTIYFMKMQEKAKKAA